MSPNPPNAKIEQLVDEALADYTLRIDRGEPIDREEFLRQHAGIAHELRAYFATSDEVRRTIDNTEAPSKSIESPRPKAGDDPNKLPATIGSNRAVNESASHPSPLLYKVPGYEIVREIGRGGMGVVYEAIQKGKNRRVALKVIACGPQSSPGATELFLRETSVLSQLRHKRIVEFYEVGMATGQVYLSMEYVDAIDVREHLSTRSSDVEIGYYCGIICQVLDALRYTHDQGLVHRDIKPQNILVSREGRKLKTKLADFGLAKYFDTAGFSEMTAEGETRGTLTFMAPEQIANSRYAKPSCDIYAVGATLYYYLTSDYPYHFGTSRNLYEVSRIVRENPHIPLRQRRADIPEELAGIVDTALAKDVASRFSSAAQMYAALFPFAKRYRS